MITELVMDIIFWLACLLIALLPDFDIGYVDVAPLITVLNVSFDLIPIDIWTICITNATSWYILKFNVMLIEKIAKFFKYDIR